MKRRLKFWLKVAVSLAALAGVAALFLYSQVVLPAERMDALVQAGGEGMSDQEVREICHDCLRWIDHHEALLILIEIGDESSIPFLIRSLNRLRDTQMCPKDHCIEALENITGERFGEDIDAWNTWYEER